MDKNIIILEDSPAGGKVSYDKRMDMCMIDYGKYIRYYFDRINGFKGMLPFSFSRCVKKLKDSNDK